MMPARKRGAPIGNQNAVGNRGGAPFGNTNALKHGGYAAISWDDLTDSEWELVTSMPTDCEQLLIDEIALLSIRERRIMQRIAWAKGLKDGLAKSATVRMEEKRVFAGVAEEHEYLTLMDEAVSSREQLLGQPYRMTVTLEAVHNIILRMEEDLSHCQEIKRKAVELLIQIHPELPADKVRNESGVADALLASQRGKGKVISPRMTRRRMPPPRRF